MVDELSRGAKRSYPMYLTGESPSMSGGGNHRLAPPSATPTPGAQAVARAYGSDSSLIEDGKSLALAFDEWLSHQTNGWVNLERIYMLASVIPVVGSVLSVIDIFLTLKDVFSKGSAEFFDWVDLAINLIGIIPGAGAAVKVSARPVLHLIRSNLNAHTVKNLSEAVVEIIVTKLAEDMVGDIEKFVEYIETQVEVILKEAADIGGQIIEGLAEVADKVALGQLFDTSTEDARIATLNEELDKQSSSTLEDCGTFLKIFVLAVSAGYQRMGNYTLNTLLSESDKSVVRNFAGVLRRYAKQLRESIPTLGAKILELMRALKAGLQKRRGRVSHTTVGTTQVTRHTEVGTGTQFNTTRGAGNDTNGSRASPNKNCTACPPCSATRHSIDYATGQETFSHLDFKLPGTFAIEWSRLYNSSLEEFNHGELGARWMTPYTSKINDYGYALVYYTDDGRRVRFPRLEVGQAHDDVIEQLSLLRVSEDMLILSHRGELVRMFERQGLIYRLAALKNRQGQVIALHYHEGLLVLMTDAHGHHVSFDYTPDLRIQEIRLAKGGRSRVLARYEYDYEGNLSRAYDQYGDDRTYRYQHHLITRYTDRTGVGINLEWDGWSPKAKCIREYDDNHRYDVRLAWHASLRQVSVTDGLNHTQVYEYDREGYTTRIMYADGTEEWLMRDERKNITAHYLRNGGVEHRTYDAQDHLVSYRQADGHLNTYRYNERHDLIEHIDPLGQRWRYAYNETGQRVRTEDPLGQLTRYVYNDQGRLTQQTDATGGVHVWAWNPYGKLLSDTDCSGKTTTYKYDYEQRLISQTDAGGATTTYHYNERDQRTKVVLPDQTVLGYEYDAESRLLWYRGPGHTGVSYEYDRSGDVITRKQGFDAIVRYHYHPNGALAKLVNENGSHYTFDYNEVGELKRETTFENKVIDYHYTSGSGTLSHVINGGVEQHYTFDLAGRLTSRTAMGQTEHLIYDPMGRLVDIKTPHVHHQYEYDRVGHLVQEHQHYRFTDFPLSMTWRHEYDALGQRIRTERPDGQVVDHLRYGSGHVHGLLWNKDEILALERNDRHQEIHRRYGNGVTQTSVLNDLGQLTRSTIQRGTSERSRAYLYTAAYEVQRIYDDVHGIWNYEYDGRGQLLLASLKGRVELFEFDPAGNRYPIENRSERFELSRHPGRRHPDDLYGNLLKRFMNHTYEYDSRGNLIRLRNDIGVDRRFEWDGFNRLVKVRQAQEEIEYVYDAHGRRIAKCLHEVGRSKPSVTYYGWDGDQLAMELTDDEKVHYVYLPESVEPVFQERTPLRVKTYYSEQGQSFHRDPPKRYYYHLDHLGTPVEVTDETGAVAWDAKYWAWGRAEEILSRTAQSAGFKNPFRFQGQYYDEETGLHYNRFRYYDPRLGRYISEDPIRLRGGLNTYQYAPNPTGWVDPLGLAGNRAERRAQQILQDIDAREGGHSYARHGAHTTMEDQYIRSTTGIPPGGCASGSGKPTTASKFDSHVTHLDAVQRARAERSRVINEQGNNSGNRNSRRRVNFDMGDKTAGSGYIKGGGELRTTSEVEGFFNGDGNLITLYPNIAL